MCAKPVILWAMGRFISIISGILALSLFLPGCSREVVEKPANPRLAKSGEKLTKEEGIPVASDSSESIPDEDKRSGNITTGDATPPF